MPDLEIIYDFAQPYIKSKTCFCFTFTDLIFLLKSSSLSIAWICAGITVLQERDVAYQNFDYHRFVAPHLLTSSFFCWIKGSSLDSKSDRKFRKASSIKSPNGSTRLLSSLIILITSDSCSFTQHEFYSRAFNSLAAKQMEHKKQMMRIYLRIVVLVRTMVL